MTRDHGAEAAAWLAGRTPTSATVSEIAAGISARVADVREALTADNRFFGPFTLPSQPRRVLFTLAPKTVALAFRDGSGQVHARPSQASRILAVLADRRPHSVTDIHRLAGTCRLNSRVAELRRRVEPQGLTITCTRLPGPSSPDRYVYQLTEAAAGVKSRSEAYGRAAA